MRIATWLAEGADIIRALGCGDALVELPPGEVIDPLPDVAIVAGPADWPRPTKVVTLKGTDVDGMLDDVRRVAKAIGRAERGRELALELRRRLSGNQRVISDQPMPRVVLLSGCQPPLLAGGWVTEVMAQQGLWFVGHPVRPGEPERRTTWAAIAALDPEIIICLPHGQDLSGAIVEASSVAGRPTLAACRAVRAGQVWAVDAARLFAHGGPTIVLASEVLVAIILPSLVPSFVPPIPPDLAFQVSPGRAP